MQDRLCLKAARDSLKTIRDGVESGKHILAGIYERLATSGEPAEQPTASFLESVLDRLEALKEDLRQEIEELERLSFGSFKDNADDRFSDERLVKYREINETLFAIEKKINQDFKQLMPQCEQMQKDGIIDDFEIETAVFVLLDEKDPAYRDDADNILAVSSFDAKIDVDSDFGLADGKNHNEYQYLEGHPMQKAHHCWLFHEFYDHSSLWDDILRVGTIWLDTTVRYQNYSCLNRQSSPRFAP